MMPDWPDWPDVGRRVRLTMPSGERIVGRLEAAEFFTGEDEVPVFSVRTDDGYVESFASATAWEFEA